MNFLSHSLTILINPPERNLAVLETLLKETRGYSVTHFHMEITEVLKLLHIAPEGRC